MQREHWLAVRASPSLGRLFRERGRFAHVSKPLEVEFAEQIHGDVRRYGAREYLGVTPDRGKTLHLGRNAAKRALRKGPRKCWRVLGRA